MKNIKLWLVLTLLLFNDISISNAGPEVKASILHPNGLLWKIEKPPSSVSYLYGTMHVSDPRVTRLAAPVEKAFGQANHFVMEVLMNFETIGYVSRLSFFDDGRTLSALMGKRDYGQLTRLLDKRIFIAEEVINNMKPWAVLMLLMLPADQQIQTKPALDMVLYKTALQRKMQVSGLETVQEQIGLFESMQMKDQLWLLNRAIKDIDATDALFPQMLSAYINRDLAGLMNIQSEFMYPDSDIDDRFMNQLLDTRNVRMANRLSPVLKQGNAFIAIGALHLPGKGGVLDLLEAQGYKVTPVY